MNPFQRWPAASLAIAIVGTLCLPNRAEAGDFTKTKHPIVLAHGMAGFDQLFGIYEYWDKIPATLSKDGAKVFVTEVPQFNSTEARGEVLLAQVEEILAITGATKVNLIGHSHGGLDVRYVASVAPGIVASVTTVGSPHHGAELADFLRSNVKGGGFTEGVLALFANGLGNLLSLLSGTSNQQDAIAALGALSTEGLSVFNAAHPAGLPADWCGQGKAVEGGIRFYSWTGTSALTNLLDPSDAMLGLASIVYAEDNDGLVGRCSAHLGKVIRDDYRLNHLDEVNQAFGLVHLFGPDPKSLFRTHANRLKNEGV